VYKDVAHTSLCVQPSLACSLINKLFVFFSSGSGVRLQLAFFHKVDATSKHTPKVHTDAAHSEKRHMGIVIIGNKQVNVAGAKT